MNTNRDICICGHKRSEHHGANEFSGACSTCMDIKKCSVFKFPISNIYLPAGYTATNVIMLMENPLRNTRHYRCTVCDHNWFVPMDDVARPEFEQCPNCDDAGHHEKLPVFVLVSNTMGVFHDT